MYLLYVDESGTTHDPNQQYFVLAGFCVFERQGYWISNQLDQIAAIPLGYTDAVVGDAG